MTTQIHDSDTCRAGTDGASCEMCRFAREFEKSSAKSPSEASSTENQGIEQGVSEPENALQVKYGSGIAISAPDFEHEWSTAPAAHTRYTEKAEAEWWLTRGLWLGIQYERERGLLALNGDLREMQRIARERITR